MTSVYGEEIDAPEGIPVVIEPMVVLPSELGGNDALGTVPPNALFR